MTTRLSTATTRAPGATCPTPSPLRSARRCRRSVEAGTRSAAPQAPRRAVVEPGELPRRLHLTARGRLFALTAIVLLLVGAFAVGRSASSEAGVDTVAPVALTQHTVAPGDTLWSVARALAPRRDPRDVVEQIRRLNHLDTPSVQAGQQLLLPALR